MSTEKTTANPVKTNWTEQKAKLKAKFPVLSDDDLKYEDGKKDEMMAKLQTKLNKSKDELATIISAF
jgi:uncharacterized protein YjbJ (UPF0337 family)